MKIIKYLDKKTDLYVVFSLIYSNPSTPMKTLHKN